MTSVDAVVDGVHFTLEQFGPRAVGRKALAAALSDLAAMGAEPGEAYVALGVPEGIVTRAAAASSPTGSPRSPSARASRSSAAT